MRLSFFLNLFKPRRTRPTASGSWATGPSFPNASAPSHQDQPDFGTVFCTPPTGLLEAGAVFPTQKQGLPQPTEFASSRPVVGGSELGPRHALSDRTIAVRPRPQRPLTRPPHDILVIHTPPLGSITPHTRPESLVQSKPSAPPVPPAPPIPRTSRRHRAPTPPIDPNLLAPPGGHPRRRRLPTTSPVSDFPIQGWVAAPSAHDHRHPPAAESDSPNLTVKDRQRRLAVLYAEVEHLVAAGPHPVTAGIVPVLPNEAAAKSGIVPVPPNEAAARSGVSQPMFNTAPLVPRRKMAASDIIPVAPNKPAVSQPVFSTAPLVPRRTRPAPAGKIPEVGPFMNTEMVDGDCLRHDRPSEPGSNGENMPDQAPRAALRGRHRAQIDHRLVGLGLYSASNDLAAHAYPTCV